MPPCTQICAYNFKIFLSPSRRGPSTGRLSAFYSSLGMFLSYSYIFQLGSSTFCIYGSRVQPCQTKRLSVGNVRVYSNTHLQLEAAQSAIVNDVAVATTLTYANCLTRSQRRTCQFNEENSCS